MATTTGTTTGTPTGTMTGTPDPAGDPDGVLEGQRTFRASTLDEAVAEARSELGAEVELIEAHRVRRGGLGGFFATDLGVEIIAAPRRAAAPVDADDQDRGDAIVTGLDRLIRHADASDRASAVIAPPDMPVEQLTSPDAHPFAEQLTAVEDEAAALEWPAPTDDSGVDERFAPADDWPHPAGSASAPLVGPSEFIDQPLTTDAGPVRPQTLEATHDRAATVLFDDCASDHVQVDDDLSASTPATGVELAPPSSLLNGRSIEPGGALDDLDALLREVGIDLTAARSESTVVPVSASVPMRIDDVAALASAQLVESVGAFAGIDQQVAQISVTIRTHDGTTVSVATELAG